MTTLRVWLAAGGCLLAVIGVVLFVGQVTASNGTACGSALDGTAAAATNPCHALVRRHHDLGLAALLAAAAVFNGVYALRPRKGETGASPAE
jgi:drug/metabolite transporter (DMT)-like permease